MNGMKTTSARQTKYCDAIKSALNSMGHATNSELLVELKKDFSELSATTVHRATARLAERGEIAIAPHTMDGVMRYDSNVSAHDHFLCNRCDMLRDADIMHDVASILESSIGGGCRISGRLTIGGVCKRCEAAS